ncbi:MAG: hypothetical protein IT289_12370 [Oligoflexia bacterium]|nr:hypothetical protein [Oligoflexia bacterium]
MKYMAKALVIVVLVTVWSACNKSTSSKTPENPVSDTNVAAAKIYPHNDEFKANHGSHFKEDRMLCARCHGSRFDGGQSKVSCATCHASYPHHEAWAVPQNHGAEFVKLSADERAACLKCHGAEKPTSGISCNHCHKAFPHGDTHGEWAVTFDGKCAVCHTDFKRMLPEGGCAGCHEGTFSLGWISPTPTPKPSVKESKNLSPNQKRKPTSKLKGKKTH